MKRGVLLIGLPVIAIAAAVVFYLLGGRYATTDNAYIQSSLALISPEVSGPVKNVPVKENQLVKAGDVIFQIDDAAFKVARDRAVAKLAQVKIDFEGLKASYSEKQVEIDSAQTKYDYAQKAFFRQSSLAAKNVLSDQAMDDATQASKLALQQISQLQQDLSRIRASLGGSIDTPLEAYPAYVSARADVEQAELDLVHTQVKSPADGWVSKLPALGQYETLGTVAFALVASAHMRVDANFTETEITHVQPGQAVTVTVDTYPGITWKGTVDSLSPATGASFSVIPAQNATGNWVKIAQRVPVRIKLDPVENGPQLRVGMSASVSIDTGYRRSLRDLGL